MRTPASFAPTRTGILGSLAAVLLVAGAGVARGQYSYRTNFPDTNTITIIKYTGTGGAVSIPGTINGLTVSSIEKDSMGDGAFEGCTNLTGVTIPDSVTYIGGYAFNACFNLTNVVIGSSVTNIGDYAFGGSYMTGIYFMGNAPSMDWYVFCDPNLTIYYLPWTTGWSTNVAGYPAAIWKLFNYTTNSDGTITITGFNRSPPPVSSVTIPSKINGLTVSSILGGTFNGQYIYGAFEGCASLTSVTIPDSVTNIGDGWINEYGTTFLGAFSGCFRLTHVTIGTNVTSIGVNAFFGCGLTNVTIPNSVTNIGVNAFSGCTSLTNVIIGTNVASIGDGAFSGCRSLIKAIIPDSVINMGQATFYDCTSLTNATIGNEVVYIWFSAFRDCTSLTSVTIGNGVIGIEQYAFMGCTSLTSVTIPASVTGIGDSAFADCYSLTSVYFKGNAPGFGGGWVFDSDTNAISYCLPGTTGWGSTALWLPKLSSDSIHSNQFGFNINWASGMVCVVEACTNLTTSSWHPLQTNALPADLSYFSDPGWTNNPRCFYRVRWQ